MALARLILGWQDVREMHASENQFSFTRAAPGTGGRAKDQILISFKGRVLGGATLETCLRDGGFSGTTYNVVPPIPHTMGLMVAQKGA